MDDLNKYLTDNSNEDELSIHDQILFILNGKGFYKSITQEATILASMIRSTALTLKFVPILPNTLDSMPSEYMEFVYYLWNKELDSNKNIISL